MAQLAQRLFSSVQTIQRWTQIFGLSFVVTNCGGNVGNESPGTTKPVGGSTAFTGTGGTGGTGGVTSTVGGTKSCGSDDDLSVMSVDSCWQDSDCNDGEFCDVENCVSPCGCHGGTYVCVNSCVAKCAPIVCPAPNRAIATAISGQYCDVVVRIDAASIQVKSYRVICGDQKTITQQEAWDQLRPMARINWSTATPYGSADAGYLFVHESEPYDVVAFGPTTGQMVLEFLEDGSSSRVLGDYIPLSSGPGNCESKDGIFGTPLGPWDANLATEPILQALYAQGILSGIAQGNGGYNSISLISAPLAQPEYMVIIGTTPRV